MLEFHKIELTDMEKLRPVMLAENSRSSETTFANLYLWSRQYPTGFAFRNGMLLLKAEEYDSFAFPMGDGDLKETVDFLTAYTSERGSELMFQVVTRDQFARLDALFPGRFQIEYDRDEAEYLYLTENLAKLSGRKYHGKKNHVNKFKKLYPDWSYERVSRENLEDCFQMALRWRNVNGCEEDEEKNAEMCVALNALRLFEELELEGGLLRVNGQVIAFTLGERANEDTFVVHIEKADTEYEGAYTMINQQFAANELLGRYTYVNREDDLGEEGLRTAKLSYRPVGFEDKGYVTERKTDK